MKKDFVKGIFRFFFEKEKMSGVVCPVQAVPWICLLYREKDLIGRIQYLET